MTPPLRRKRWFLSSVRRASAGSFLLEVSLAMGVAALLALMLMKASLLAVSGNQWAMLQTLSDAALTREVALANRVPFAQLDDEDSLWPDVSEIDSGSQQTVTLGKMRGGFAVTARITRFRVAESAVDDSEAALVLWRLHSILRYEVGKDEYVKSCSTLRVQ